MFTLAVPKEWLIGLARSMGYVPASPVVITTVGASNLEAKPAPRNRQERRAEAARARRAR